MTAAADLVLTNAEVHTLGDPDVTAEAVSVRGGEIIRVGTAYEASFLVGVDTTVIDLGGRVLLPGFVDAHTHMLTTGQYERHADLRGASGPAECLARLREADEGDGWVLGFGFDESTWTEEGELRLDDLDTVSDDRPVAAFREDLHLAVVNGAVLRRVSDQLDDAGVVTEGGDLTGVVVDGAIEAVFAAIEPDPAEARELLRVAQGEAHRHGVTAVHDMVKGPAAPRAYRELELAGELALRVRLNYWHEHLDAALETGLLTNHGSRLVRTGAIKAYADGSLGARTAKLSTGYADGDGSGQWVTTPEGLRGLVRLADGAGFQVAVHAIGDAAIGAALEAFADEAAEPGRSRHRIEHLELATDAQIERLAELGVIASVQPNFLKWAGEGGLYDARLGAGGGAGSNRFRELADAGVRLAFGSDGMPLGPLFGVHQAVTAPAESQRLSVTEALRAYTAGGAYAGFDEGRAGTIGAGKRADLVALERSPWDHPGEIAEIGVALTIVDGEVVYDGRSSTSSVHPSNR